MKRGVGARPPRYERIALALLLANLVSVTLFFIRIAGTQTVRYNYLLWNLFLAWLPFLFAWWLTERLQAKRRWADPSNLVLTVAWLLFLPNSFYLISDLIHLRPTAEVNVLYDAVMFTSFILNGIVAGFISVYLIHTQLLKRFVERQANGLVVLVFLLSGFAIYLGRSLRWNSWDLVANPFGLLYDVSDRIINPVAHPQAFLTTFTVFLLLLSLYFVVWEFARVIKR